MTPARVIVLSSTFPQYTGDPRGQFLARYWQKRAQREALELTVLAPQTKWSRDDADLGLRVERFTYVPQRFASLTGRFGMLENCREAPWRLATLPSFLVAQRRALAHLVDSISPSYLAAHMFLPCGLAVARLARQRGLPFELFGHGTDVDLALRLPTIWRKEMQWALTNAKAVYFPSAEKLERTIASLGLRGFAGNFRVETCRDTVATPHLQGIESERTHVLFLGRLIAQKCVDDLLRAAASIKNFPPLDIAGDGPLRAKLTKLAENLGVRATFHGFVEGEARERLFARARLMCVPSRAVFGLSEGAPLVIAEARARGILVVARPEGGIAEMCGRDSGCLLVDDLSPLALRRGLLQGLAATAQPSKSQANVL